MYNLCIFRTTCTVAKYVPAPPHSDVGSTMAAIFMYYNARPAENGSAGDAGRGRVQSGYDFWVAEMFVLLAQKQKLPFPKTKHPNSQLLECEKNTALPLSLDLWLFECLFPKFLWMELAKE